MLNVSVDNKTTYTIEKKENKWLLNNKEVNWDSLTTSNGLISILYNQKSYLATVETIDKEKKEVTVKINGVPYTLSIQEPIDLLLSKMGMDNKSRTKAEQVKAPMPGMVLKILVKENDAVVKGTPLLILEAMKMENVLKAGHDAIVKSIKVNEKTAVEKGAVLIELK
jgi:biotin carboxyl carrier protein